MGNKGDPPDRKIAESHASDRERDLKLRRAGYTVHRYTGDQLRTHPAEISAELGEVIGGDSG